MELAAAVVEAAVHLTAVLGPAQRGSGKPAGRHAPHLGQASLGHRHVVSDDGHRATLWGGGERKEILEP